MALVWNSEYELWEETDESSDDEEFEDEQAAGATFDAEDAESDVFQKRPVPTARLELAPAGRELARHEALVSALRFTRTFRS